MIHCFSFVQVQNGILLVNDYPLRMSGYPIRGIRDLVLRLNLGESIQLFPLAARHSTIALQRWKEKNNLSQQMRSYEVYLASDLTWLEAKALGRMDNDLDFKIVSEVSFFAFHLFLLQLAYMQLLVSSG